jgi:hypothetical protein
MDGARVIQDSNAGALTHDDSTVLLDELLRDSADEMPDAITFEESSTSHDTASVLHECYTVFGSYQARKSRKINISGHLWGRR